MTDWIYLFTLSFCFSAAELIAGGFGLMLPLTALAVFYLTIAYGWRATAPAAVLCAVGMDLALARDFPAALTLIAATMVFAAYWLRKGGQKSVLANIFPGIVLAVALVAPFLAIELLSPTINPEAVKHDVFNLVLAILFAAPGLPLMIAVLDEIAESLRLKRFMDARKNIFERW